MTTLYKAFTQTLCSPIQGGPPVWDGTLPYTLPPVAVDTGPDDCGAGWNACRSPADALRIAGLWPDGWPVRLFDVKPLGEVIEREKKCRFASGSLTSEITDLRPAILEMSAPFGDFAKAMTDEQLAWHHALGRPEQDPAAVESGLRDALDARGLSWALRRYDTARATRAAGDAFDTRAAWAAWDAFDTMAAWAAGDAFDAWAARAAWAAWDAWAARAVWAALVHFYAATCKWISAQPEQYTIGIRDAYIHGLSIAIPVESGVLGWAMV